MQLPIDFHDLIDPRDLRNDDQWLDLALHRKAAYQRRFFVHGLRAAAQTLGLRSSRALWAALQGAGGRPARGAAAERDDPVARAILAAVPARWKADLPDINDRGEAKAHTTYWREFSHSQLLKAWEISAQSLPKALLSIVALALAAEAKGGDWPTLIRESPVAIRPSIFWLVDYTEEVHDRYVAANLAAARDAYRACGLEFDIGPNRRSDALRQAAKGEATVTLLTAERLCRWLEARHNIACGPVRMTPTANRLGVAPEIFTIA